MEIEITYKTKDGIKVRTLNGDNFSEDLATVEFIYVALGMIYLNQKEQSQLIKVELTSKSGKKDTIFEI